jgi:hypothetical protein
MKKIIILFSLLFLSGCGGGSDDSSIPVTMQLEATIQSPTLVTLIWSTIPGRSHYIYVNGEGGNGGSSGSLTIRLSPNTHYCIYVAALYGGLATDRSNEVCITMPKDDPPSRPTITSVSATENPSHLSIEWSSTSDDYSTPRYTLYRDDVLITNTDGLFHLDTELDANTEYCYTLKAYDNLRQYSVASPPVCGTTITDNSPPTPPTRIYTNPLAINEIELSWYGSTDDGKVDRYKIYRDSMFITEVANNNQFIDSNLNTYQQYCYTVSAIDGGQNESTHSIESCTTTSWNMQTITSVKTYEVGNDFIYDQPTYNEIAIDSQNRLHMGFNAEIRNITTNTYEYKVRYATNNNGKWNINDVESTGFPDYPITIAIDNNDNIFLAYDDFNLQYSINSTGAWASNIIIPGNLLGGSIYEASLAVDSIGNIYLAYELSNEIFVNNNAAGSWLAEKVASTSIWFIDIKLDSNNDIHLLYTTTDNNLVYATNKTGAWLPETLANSNSYSLKPSFALDSNDNVHIVYTDSDGSTSSVYYLENSSGNWLSSTLATSNENLFRGCKLAVDSNDHVHISYAESYRVHYVSNDTGNWLSTILYQGSQPISGSTSIALDTLDRPYITYMLNGRIKLATYQ